MRALRLVFALVCVLGICAAASAQDEPAVSGSGGTLTAPTTLGQYITVTNVRLPNGSTASLDCQITFFGVSTYQWKWECGNGKITVGGATMATVQGTMTLTCSGGGRTHPTTCWHTFSGTATDNDSDLGSVTASAKGSTNNAPGTVTAFNASW